MLYYEAKHQQSLGSRDMARQSSSPKRTKSAPQAGKQPAEPAPVECRHCKGGPETFRYMKRSYVFDVDRAREIVQDGRQPLELEPDDTRHSVDISRIYPEH